MVSIKDVAEHAGVAISTVSKVLNHYPNVSERTRKQVEKAIEELHYVPNTIAAALSSKQFARVALIVNLTTQTQAIDEITMQYLAGGISKAKELNIEVVTIFFSMISEMSLEELTRYLQSLSITGVVLYGISKEDHILAELVNREIFKCVIVDAPLVNTSTSCVWVDQEQAQYDVVSKALEDEKRKRILYIAGKRNGFVTDGRLRGIYRIAKERGLTVKTYYGDFSELQARNIALKYAKYVDMIVCASDLMAIGAMNACIDMDIFRPVCGFDGITLMGYVGKQMNTVKQNFFQISSKAVEELYRLMNGGEGMECILPHEIIKLYYRDIIC